MVGTDKMAISARWTAAARLADRGGVAVDPLPDIDQLTAQRGVRGLQFRPEFIGLRLQLLGLLVPLRDGGGAVERFDARMEFLQDDLGQTFDAKPGGCNHLL